LRYCHPCAKCMARGANFKCFSELTGLNAYTKKNIAGIKKAPITLNQKEAVRRVFKISERNDSSRLMAYQM
jgi:hypothetical protein